MRLKPVTRVLVMEDEARLRRVLFWRRYGVELHDAYQVGCPVQLPAFLTAFRQCRRIFRFSSLCFPPSKWYQN
jgi:hypothetical protein